MNTNLNLLFGVLALQSGLIDSSQFAEVCSLWATRKDTPIVDLLLERGWLEEADVASLLYLVQRNLEKHKGDPKLTLGAIGNEQIKRQLASIKDAEIQQSLGYTPDSDASTVVTLGVLKDKPERYSLIHLHATGGGGRVWLAHDAQLDRNVAFKELRPELADDVALWARFHKEARITGQLEHPGIVPVYDYGRRANNQSFYTMRFVKGRTLAEAARDYHKKRVSGEANPLELISLLNAFTTVCNTIAYAHSRGVIHRDLKGRMSFSETLVK